MLTIIVDIPFLVEDIFIEGGDLVVDLGLLGGISLGLGAAFALVEKDRAAVSLLAGHGEALGTMNLDGQGKY